MDEVFENVIAEGRTINNETGGHVGQEIYYSVDELNLLEGFSPVEDASPEHIAAYRKQQRKTQRKGKVRQVLLERLQGGADQDS